MQEIVDQHKQVILLQQENKVLYLLFCAVQKCCISCFWSEYCNRDLPVAVLCQFKYVLFTFILTCVLCLFIMFIVVAVSVTCTYPLMYARCT